MSTAPPKEKAGPVFANETGQEQDVTASSRIAEKSRSVNLWYAAAVADEDRLLKHSPGQYTILAAIWRVLVREAFFKKTCRITLADDIIAQRTGLNRRTILRAKNDLEKTHLVKLAPTERDRSTGRMKPTRWHIKPSVKPYFEIHPRDTESQGPSDNQSQGSPCDFVEGSTKSQTLTSPPSACPSSGGKGGVRKKTPPASHSHAGGRLEAAAASEAGKREEDPNDWRSVAAETRRRNLAAADGGEHDHR